MTSENEHVFDKSDINTARGIGIILVVAGHLAFPLFSDVHIYVYHMPFFFFLSGIGLDSRRGMAGMLVHDFKNLLVYAAAMTFFYSVIGKIIQATAGIPLVTFSGFGLENYTVKLFTANSHHVLLFLVGWFLVALFFARPLATLAVRAAARLPAGLRAPVLLLLGLALCWVGIKWLGPAFHATKNTLLNLGAQIAVAAGFALIGHLAMTSRHVLRAVRHPLAGVLFAVAAYESIVLLGGKPMSMAWSEYPAGFWRHMLSALLAILAVLNLASLVARSGNGTLAYIGTHSKSIMSHHLFVFTSINLVLAGFGVMAFKDLGIWSSYNPQVTWPVYVALGVGLPILVEEARRRLVRAGRARWDGVSPFRPWGGRRLAKENGAASL